MATPVGVMLRQNWTSDVPSCGMRHLSTVPLARNACYSWPEEFPQETAHCFHSGAQHEANVAECSRQHEHAHDLHTWVSCLVAVNRICAHPKQLCHHKQYGGSNWGQQVWIQWLPSYPKKFLLEQSFHKMRQDILWGSYTLSPSTRHITGTRPHQLQPSPWSYH